MAAGVVQQRQIYQLQRAKSAPQRLAAADRLVQEGNLKTACLVYARLAVARPPSPYSEIAKTRLRQLRDDARRKLQEIDGQLEQVGGAVVPDLEQVAELFAQYDQLVKSSAEIPYVGREIAAHVARQRRDPRYSVLLRETQLRQLLSLGGPLPPRD